MLQLAAYGGDSASAAARKLAAGIRLFEDACTSEAQWHRLDAKATVATGARPAPLVLTIGQAEVLNNVLRLTPLVKGVGQAGAAWLLRPLSVMHGFETLFKLRITRPKVGRHCNDPADGFAFVLHRDPKRAAALGGSGTQLGYGGMENVIAVQFCVRPSCAEQHAEDPVKSLALDFNEKVRGHCPSACVKDCCTWSPRQETGLLDAANQPVPPSPARASRSCARWAATYCGTSSSTSSAATRASSCSTRTTRPSPSSRRSSRTRRTRTW
ncbi:hypothetical protein T492DRAFT_452577 [Pavlovales sp. CCMP2436]|nr:hypothetical protein T492DRAFT_452577 [Pavlovales sp. CCMP2436]